MRLTIRDGLATLFVAAAVAVYLPWLAGAALTGWSARGVAVVVFALGFAACVADQKQMAVVYGTDRRSPRPPAAYVVFASVLGALALVSGVAALVTGNTALLATLVVAMAGLWLAATARHAASRPAGGHASGTAARPV